MPMQQEDCWNSVQASGALFALALIWLTSVCTLATLWSQSPSLQQLGLHPRGRHLGEWFWHSFTTGIQGYDVIQGTMSPALRLQCHGVALLVLWSLLNLIFGNAELEDAICASHGRLLFQGIPQGVWTTGSYAMVVYLVSCMISSWCMDGVSMPGGPRVFKLGRTPQWPDRWTDARSELADGDDDDDKHSWRCETAQQAHDTTHAQYPGYSLTGEPAGRQIWTNQPQPEQQDENLPMKLWKTLTTDPNLSKQSQEMAQGGRSEFAFNPSRNPNSCDMVFRKQQIEKYVRQGGKLPSPEPAKTVHEACRKAAHFYSMLQCEDGHWAADYGGPHFLMPGLVVAWYVMGKPDHFLNASQIRLLIKYILSHQQTDGGWGTHLESPSTMFGSTMMYVALRLLGRPADDSACVQGRNFLKKHGGALYTSSWSKFYLCILGCMDWKGHNSVPPEMWILPNWCPFHPGRMWCHARMVYLPMGYLYGNRFVYPKAETDPLIHELRNELYCEDYSKIDWIPTRHWVAATDNYSPIPWVMKVIQNVLARYENWAIFRPFRDYVRQKGLQFSMEYIRAEDLQTNYIDIGPVNKVLNMISHFHATGGDLEDPSIVKHLMRVPDYLWVAEDGMKMQGYNGSQCWDTSFCAQAFFESGLVDVFPETSTKIWNYLELTQILSTEVSQASPAFQYEDNKYRQQFYRHISKGGWPFSTSAHGWPISDCTGEGLKASLCLYKSECVQKGLKDGTLRPISDKRLFEAANILLTYQNEDGGWATYENNRGWGWYEQLNPSEVFGDIMIDYSYVECSMASLTALVDFQERFPDHRKEDIQHAIEKGRDFLKSIQRDDGSWYGSWACCFTYGMWFGIEGLVKCGEPFDSPCVVDACKFLLKHQRLNGGWGEDFTSCYDKDYAKEGMKAYGDDGSGIVNTSWALLALSMAKCPDVSAIQKGVNYLMKRQLPSGDWPQEGISGVFNRSVGITYTAYRNVFPLWALGRCHEEYGDELDAKE